MEDVLKIQCRESKRVNDIVWGGIAKPGYMAPVHAGWSKLLKMIENSVVSFVTKDRFKRFNNQSCLLLISRKRNTRGYKESSICSYSREVFCRFLTYLQYPILGHVTRRFPLSRKPVRMRGWYGWLCHMVLAIWEIARQNKHFVNCCRREKVNACLEDGMLFSGN